MTAIAADAKPAATVSTCVVSLDVDPGEGGLLGIGPNGGGHTQFETECISKRSPAPVQLSRSACVMVTKDTDSMGLP